MMEKIRGIFSQYGVVAKLLILVGISCFFTSLGTMLWMLFFGGDITGVISLKWMQLFQSLGMFLIPPFVFAFFCSTTPRAFLHFDRHIVWSQVVMVVLFMLIAIPAINMIAGLNQLLVLPQSLSGMETWMKAQEEMAAKLTGQFLGVNSVPAFLFNILLMALIPALGEEIFFRGALQGIFRQKMNVHAAIWIAAILFSSIHLQFYGFFPRMLLGACFGYLLFWSGNMWLPIVAHFTNNALSVVFYYLKNIGIELPDIDTIGTGNTLWTGFLSVFLCTLLFALLKKRIGNDSASPAG